jgi:hypothetical protein
MSRHCESDDGEPIRIDTTRRVVLNPLFKKPGALAGLVVGQIRMGNACGGASEAWRAGAARRVKRREFSRSTLADGA